MASLKEHIAALGGDVDADYDLVKDADSDLGDVPESDPNLAREVAKFAITLNFNKLRSTAIVDDEDVEKAAQEEELPNAIANVAETAHPTETKFIIAPASQWYLSPPPLPPKAHIPAPSPEFLAAKAACAAALLEQDAATYVVKGAHTSSASDARFLSRVLASGTLSDRLSALTLLAQASPVHNTRALDTLRGMAAKRGRDESLKALRALVDWWVGGGAPNRKLKYFRDQPLTHPDVTEQHLVLWHFEDWLKKFFFGVLQLLEGLAGDPLPYVRTQAMHLGSTLLREKPEQEQNLLRLLVHKLGDSDKAVASKASYLLLQLLQPHPQMKAIIVADVAALALAPTSAPHAHARYYAVVTCNQIVLSPADRAVAARLVDLYMALFRTLLGDSNEGEAPAEGRDFTPKKRGGRPTKKAAHKSKHTDANIAFAETPDAHAKLVAQLLTGLNRALPFAPTESAEFSAHIDTLFRIVHTGTFSASVQALTLLQRAAPPDRFIRALYASLTDLRLPGAAGAHARYLNLVFRALRAEKEVDRVAGVARRFVQVLGAVMQPSVVCGGLFLLGELFENAPREVREMMSVPRVENVPEEERYDARKRDPQHARALSSCMWELVPLQTHYHPAVALGASKLLRAERVAGKADLALHSLGHFLDRFVYRNARRRPKGGSAMQPGVGTGEGDRVEGADEMRSETFLKRGEEDVPAEQVFFHRFFVQKREKDAERERKGRKRKGKKEEVASEAGEEIEASGSDKEEAEIWKAMKASVPELGGSDIDVDEEGDVSDEGNDSSVSGDEEGGISDDGGDDGGDGSALEFLEDPDDLLSDPPGLLEYDGSGSEDGDGDEWGGFDGPSKKRGRADNDGEQRRKRRKKALPTFASYEEYAGAIEEADDEELY